MLEELDLYRLKMQASLKKEEEIQLADNLQNFLPSKKKENSETPTWKLFLGNDYSQVSVTNYEKTGKKDHYYVLNIDKAQLELNEIQEDFQKKYKYLFETNTLTSNGVEINYSRKNFIKKLKKIATDVKQTISKVYVKRRN